MIFKRKIHVIQEFIFDILKLLITKNSSSKYRKLIDYFCQNLGVLEGVFLSREKVFWRYEFSQVLNWHILKPCYMDMKFRVQIDLKILQVFNLVVSKRKNVFKTKMRHAEYKKI